MPGWAESRSSTVRSISPAPTRSTTDTATCATTRPARARSDREDPTVAPPSLSAAARPTRPGSAGSRPKSRPVRTPSPRPKTSTVPSSTRRSGRFPRGTMLALVLSPATERVAPARQGVVADRAVRLEVAVKEPGRFPGGWAYFDFGDGAAGVTARPMPPERCALPRGARGAGPRLRAVLSAAARRRRRCLADLQFERYSIGTRRTPYITIAQSETRP